MGHRIRIFPGDPVASPRPGSPGTSSTREAAMGNRSRYVVVGSAAAGMAGLRALLRARRRARLRRAAGGFVDAVVPSVAGEAGPIGDEAHAPGHRHVPLTAEVREEPAPPTVRSRPFAKHRHGLRHPGKG